MNSGIFLTGLTLLFYLASLFLVANQLKLKTKGPDSDAHASRNRLFLVTWFIALLLHIVMLHLPLMLGHKMHLDVVTAASYVMWLINLILFVSSFKRRLEILALIVIPLTLPVLILPLLFPARGSSIVNMQSGLGIHILFSLLAYSMLMLASFQAILLAVQNNQLHKHQTSPFMRALPSLEDMEHLLFRLIGIGVILLGIGLVSGFFYLEHLFGAKIAHKTILSMIAWLIFSVLLYGRWRYGWRGKKAVHWTLAGFVILMLAFFGTKIIQQYLLLDKTSTTQIQTPPSGRP